MKRYGSLLAWPLLTLLAATMSPVVSAATITQQKNVSTWYGTSSWRPTANGQFDQFDGSLGTLTGVKFTVTTDARSDLTTLLDPGETAVGTLDLGAGVLVDLSTGLGAQANEVKTFAVDETCVEGLCNSYYRVEGQYTDEVADANLAAYTGTGDISWGLSSFQEISSTAPELGFSIYTDSQESLLTLEYEYIPNVPLPASAWLFGSGLLGLLRLGRRKAA